MKKLRKWRRHRRFLKAYKILRNEAEHHKRANHITTFEAVDTRYILLRCTSCPEPHPLA